MFASTFQALFSPESLQRKKTSKNLSCGVGTFYNPNHGRCELHPEFHSARCGTNTYYDKRSGTCEVDVLNLFNGKPMEIKAAPTACADEVCVNEDYVNLDMKKHYKNEKKIPRHITMDVINLCEKPSENVRVKANNFVFGNVGMSSASSPPKSPSKSIKVKPNFSMPVTLKPEQPPKQLKCTPDEATVFYEKCCPFTNRIKPECRMASERIHKHPDVRRTEINNAVNRLKKNPQKNKDLVTTCTTEEANKDYKKCCTNYNFIMNEKECKEAKQMLVKLKKPA